MDIHKAGDNSIALAVYSQILLGVGKLLPHLSDAPVFYLNIPPGKLKVFIIVRCIDEKHENRHAIQDSHKKRGIISLLCLVSFLSLYFSHELPFLHISPALISYQEIQYIPASRALGFIQLGISALAAGDGGKLLVLYVEDLGKIAPCGLKLIAFKLLAAAFRADILPSLFHKDSPFYCGFAIPWLFQSIQEKPP